MINPPLPNSPRTVVVADDDPAWRLLVRLLLEPRGYHLVEARDGVDALEVVQSAAPQILVLDLMMPRMSGLEVCRRLRTCPAIAQPGIIIMTATDDAAALASGMATGADRVLYKPFDPARLLEAVEMLVASRNHAPAASAGSSGGASTAID